MKYSDYNYFLNINKLTIQNGYEYFVSKNYKDVNLDLQGPIESITLRVNGYRTNVEFSNDKIFSFNCQCIVGQNSVLCKHVTCAIFCFIDSTENNVKNNLFNQPELSDVNQEDLMIMNKLYLENKLFEFSANPIKYEFKPLNKELIDMSLKKSNDILASINKIKCSNNTNLSKVLETIENKLMLILKINENNLNKNYHTFEEVLNHIKDFVILKINGNSYKLPFVNIENKRIDVEIVKTRIGYILSSEIVDYSNIIFNDYIYFLLVNNNLVEWYKTGWFDDYEFSTISKIEYRTKSEDLLLKRINELKNNKYLNLYFKNIDIITKKNTEISFHFDWEKTQCILKIYNPKNVTNLFFSKYTNLFSKDENDNLILSTNKSTLIKDILFALKKIKEQGKANVIISDEFFKKRSNKLNFNFNWDKNRIKLKIDSNLENDQLKKAYKLFSKGYKFTIFDNQLYDLESFDFNDFINNLHKIGINNDEESFEYNINKREIFYLNSKFSNSNIAKTINDIESKIKANYYFNDHENILKPYQIYGINWMISILLISNGCILADEMGLGKTIQTIFLLKYFYKNKNKPSLIVVPLTLINNWISEFKKFYPNIKVIPIIGTKEDRQKIINNLEDDSIYLTTYNLIRNDINNLKKHEFMNVILDEGHFIKNFNTEWTRCIKKIKSLNRIILSGTPIENNLYELWSIFDYIIPGYLGDLKQFKGQYINNNDDDSFYELSLRIKPFILQRKKIDKLALPEKNVNEIYVKMGELELTEYDNMINSFKRELSNVDNKSNKIKILALITKLRQFCCSPKLLGLNNLKDTKIDLCIDYIEKIISNNINSKIVLFSNFPSVFKIIGEKLEARNYRWLVMDGRKTLKERNEIINKFKNNLDHKILLMSLKVGGVGLNLNFADNVIIFNPWWNESSELQAIDRLHRIGQEKDVNIYKFIYEDSIESNIEILKKNKIDIINKTINNLKYEDLLKLLEKKS